MRNFRGGFIEHSCPNINSAEHYLELLVGCIEDNREQADLFYYIDLVKDELEDVRDINNKLRNLAEDYEETIKDLEDQVEDLEKVKWSLEIDLDVARSDIEYYEKQLQEA